MNINIFLLCYNESALLPHTIKHYKKYLPSCKITIYDNESTDNSVEIAKALGCNVISWSSNNIMNEDLQIELRNNCWKDITTGWIIMADMDEFVCVTENELLEEMNNGVTILQINGMEMVGESETLDLSDIDLQEINKYYYNNLESKKLCFLRESISDMNYGPGSHKSNPQGIINLSSKIYFNKHMQILGLNFFINKNIKRYERNEAMRKKKLNFHYMNNIEKIQQKYYCALNNCIQTTNT
jgi:glycosyltransferase involved in cell wall biosynthesis